jgi:hypothetical protein
MVSANYKKWLLLSQKDNSDDTLIAVSVDVTSNGIINTIPARDFEEFAAQVGHDYLAESDCSNHPFYQVRGIQARTVWWLLPSRMHGCNGHGLPKYKNDPDVIFNVAYWTPATHYFKNPWCSTWEGGDWERKGIPQELRYLERRRAAGLELPRILSREAYNRHT